MLLFLLLSFALRFKAAPNSQPNAGGSSLSVSDLDIISYWSCANISQTLKTLPSDTNQRRLQSLCASVRVDIFESRKGTDQADLQSQPSG